MQDLLDTFGKYFTKKERAPSNLQKKKVKYANCDRDISHAN